MFIDADDVFADTGLSGLDFDGGLDIAGVPSPHAGIPGGPGDNPDPDPNADGDFNEATASDSTASDDGLEGDLDFGFTLGNFTTTLRWNHLYPGNRLFSNVTLHQTRFKYDIWGRFLDNELLIRSRVRDVGIKGSWEYYLTPENTLYFGGQAIFHTFRPNVLRTAGEINDVLASRPGERLGASEWAVYAGQDLSLGSALRLNYGLRLTAAHSAGAWYVGPEPRLALRLRLGANTSAKASYSRMRQYVHRVSSSSVALPTDLWYPVTDRVKPQNAHQVAAGLTRVFPSVGVSLSVEGYVKTIDRLIEYREGASLLLNNAFEEELLSGSGRSRGLEVLLRRRAGRWTGWMGYALSKTDRRFDGLNGGRRFPAKYDRRHTFSLVSMVELTPRVTFSAVWTYMSGAWFTAQNGQFLMPNASLTTVDLVPVYTDRNAVSLAPSHRLDVSFIIKDLLGGEWHIGAYNFYNRASPFRVAIDHNGVAYQYVQQGLFGFIPSISYNFDLNL